MNDGWQIPQLGYGTWPLNDADAERMVALAIEAGYRHIDTAHKYGNQVGVGRGLRASGVPREDLFVVTKLDGVHQGADRAAEGLRVCLTQLGLDYVDLLLIHWPLPARGEFVSTWRTFEELQEQGLTRSIGVSNFKPAHLERLKEGTRVTPAVNQVQMYPGVPRTEERAHAAENGTLITAYSPLGRAEGPIRLPVVQELARKYDRTPAQVMLRWLTQLGVVAIPKTATPERLRENLDVFGFALAADEVAALTAIDTGEGVDSDVTGH